MHLHISLYYYCYYFTVADPEKPEKKSKADIICNNDTEITARIFRCKYYHFWGLLLTDYGNISGCAISYTARWIEET